MLSTSPTTLTRSTSEISPSLDRSYSSIRALDTSVNTTAGMESSPSPNKRVVVGKKSGGALKAVEVPKDDAVVRRDPLVVLQEFKENLPPEHKTGVENKANELEDV